MITQSEVNRNNCLLNWLAEFKHMSDFVKAPSTGTFNGTKMVRMAVHNLNICLIFVFYALVMKLGGLCVARRSGIKKRPAMAVWLCWGGNGTDPFYLPFAADFYTGLPLRPVEALAQEFRPFFHIE